MKVKAHEIDEEGAEDDATIEQILNRVADAQAKRGRDGPLLLSYPVHNMERAFLSIGGKVSEGNTFGKMMWLCDSWALEHY